MKTILNLAGVLSLLIVTLTGCITAPPPQGQTYKAGYVGDRNSESLGDNVFTINIMDGSSPGLHNLHVGLDVMINPKYVTLANEYEVGGIIRRLEPRVKARLSDYLPSAKTFNVHALPNLKSDIAKEAQASLMSSYSNWTHAGNFDVQVVVTSFYLTDLSSGEAPNNSRGFW